jgi:hypothetical protein
MRQTSSHDGENVLKSEEASEHRGHMTDCLISRAAVSPRVLPLILLTSKGAMGMGMGMGGTAARPQQPKCRVAAFGAFVRTTLAPSPLIQTTIWIHHLQAALAAICRTPWLLDPAAPTDGARASSAVRGFTTYCPSAPTQPDLSQNA